MKEVTAGVIAPQAKDAQIVVHNSVILLVRYLALWGLNGILVLFLPRYLGDQGLGQLQFAVSFVALFAVGVGLGVRPFIIKEVARDHSQVQTLLGTALGLRLLGAALVLGIIVLASAFMGRPVEARLVLYLAALWMVATSVAQLMAAFLQGQENMTAPALAETAGKLVVVSIGITVLVLGLGLLAYASVLVLGAVVHFASNALYVGRRFPLRVNFHIATVKRLIVGGSPFILMGFLLDVYNHIDVVMLRLFTTDMVVGWYAAASQLYRSMEFLPVALTTALLPTLARMHQNSIPAFMSIVRKSIAGGALVIVPTALGISLLSKTVITFLPYPDVFQNSVPLLTILALSMPITALLMVLGTVAIATDRQKAWALALLITVLLDVLLNALAIPYFHRAYGNGAIGAALTTLLCESLMVLLGIRLMPQGVIDRAITLVFIKVGIAGGAMAGVCLLALHAGVGPIPVIALGIATYASLVLLTRAVNLGDLLFIRDVMYQRLRFAKGSNVRGGGHLYD